MELRDADKTSKLHQYRKRKGNPPTLCLSLLPYHFPPYHPRSFPIYLPPFLCPSLSTAHSPYLSPSIPPSHPSSVLPYLPPTLPPYHPPSFPIHLPPFLCPSLSTTRSPSLPPSCLLFIISCLVVDSDESDYESQVKDYLRETGLKTQDAAKRAKRPPMKMAADEEEEKIQALRLVLSKVAIY